MNFGSADCHGIAHRGPYVAIHRGDGWPGVDSRRGSRNHRRGLSRTNPAVARPNRSTHRRRAGLHRSSRPPPGVLQSIPLRS
jgi:hypothetical protein